MSPHRKAVTSSGTSGPGLGVRDISSAHAAQRRSCFSSPVEESASRHVAAIDAQRGLVLDRLSRGGHFDGDRTDLPLAAIAWSDGHGVSARSGGKLVRPAGSGGNDPTKPLHLCE